MRFARYYKYRATRPPEQALEPWLWAFSFGALVAGLAYGLPCLSLSLRPGDRIYAYSDGVTEAENSAAERFGRDRLTAALVAPGTSDDVIAAVLTSVDAFRGQTPLNDDLTLLEIRIDAVTRWFYQNQGAQEHDAAAGEIRSPIDLSAIG